MFKISNNVIQKKVATLISANATQLELNINHHFEKIERTASLMFADEEYYLYDATAPNQDEYIYGKTTVKECAKNICEEMKQIIEKQ